MFEIGWTEMLVIAIVMIVVVGPKDLPRMLRTVGKMTAKMRGMAGDFQRQFNEALKEAELDDVKKSVDSLRSMNPASEIKKQLNPFEKAAADVRAGLDAAMKPKPSTASEPAAATPQPAEPLKNGAAALPGEGAPAIASAPSGNPTVMPAPAPASVAPAAPVNGAVAAPPAATTAKADTKPVPKAPAEKAPAAARTAAKPRAAKPAGPAKTPAAAKATKAPAKTSRKTS